jgi:Zn-dependent M28 family amino/carboxypeptidase
MKWLSILLVFVFNTVFCFSQSLTDSIIKTEALIKDVFFLASDSLQGRLMSSVGADKAAIYISTRFAAIGLKPLDMNGGFSMPIGNAIGNIVGTIAGKTKPEEIIVFSAHYDHVGTSDDNQGYKQITTIPKKYNDNIYNGANDNASGVALLLSLAEYLVKVDANERTIIFIAFTGEEQGFIGSKYFTSNISKPNSFKAVLNFDMVGRNSYENSVAYITGSKANPIIKLLNNTLQQSDKLFKKRFFQSDPFPDYQLDKRSDHVPFANMGIYAVTIFATAPTDEYYHTVNDEPQTLNFPFLQKLTQAVAVAVKPLLADAELK